MYLSMSFINVIITVTFKQFNALLLKKVLMSFKKIILTHLNCIVYKVVAILDNCMNYI